MSEIAEQLRKLKQLHDEGLIDEQEYEQQKAQVLSASAASSEAPAASSEAPAADSEPVASPVQAFLSGLGLAQYAQSFEDNAITMDNLASLTDDDLKDLGVSVLGHRKTILGEAQSGGSTSTPPPKAAAAPTAAEARAASDAKTQAQAKNLVTASTIMSILGVLGMLGGVALFVQGMDGTGGALLLATPLGGGGFVLLVIAAIVGQVGRAMQGRIV